MLPPCLHLLNGKVSTACGWILGVFDYIKRKSKMIVNGFSQTGILEQSIHVILTVKTPLSQNNRLYDVSAYSTYSALKTLLIHNIILHVSIYNHDCTMCISFS